MSHRPITVFAAAAIAALATVACGEVEPAGSFAVSGTVTDGRKAGPGDPRGDDPSGRRNDGFGDHRFSREVPVRGGVGGDGQGRRQRSVPATGIRSPWKSR